MSDYERFGGHQGSGRRGSGFGLAMTFLLIGLGAGALSALLLAPKEGKKTRRLLRRKYEDALDAFTEWKETAEDMVGRGGEWASVAKEKVTPFRRAMGR